jgi:hypothetical protein
MMDFIDYKTLAMIFVLKDFFQATALVYVWQVHRKYGPARDWAIGSLLMAFATLLLATSSDVPSLTIVIGRNFAGYAGFLFFGGGIIQACGGRVPWWSASAIMLSALIAQMWLTVSLPSISARVAIFSTVIAIGEAYVALCALRTPHGPLQRTQKVIAMLLFVQGAAMLLRGIDAATNDFVSVWQSSPLQTLFFLILMVTSFLLTMALILLTSQRTTALLEATLRNLDQGVAMFDRDQTLIICNERYGEACLAILHRLKKLGVSIALDDFGTGYSSLNYLTTFPFDRIKIDKSFVMGIENRPESSAVVAAIVGLARSLSIATTAEGVETAAQYELLRIAGCSDVQGFLLGRPQPISHLSIFDKEGRIAKRIA